MKKHYFNTYAGLPKTVYYLFAARLVNSMGFFVMPLFTLILTQKLGMDKASAGATAALMILTQAPGVILGGKLADTIGRKKMMMLGNLLGAVFYLICSLGLTGKAMIVCIILAADCGALSRPAFDALIADLTRPEDRKKAYSLLYLGINIGMALSPMIGGLLFAHHLRLIFLLDAATTLASTALIFFRVQEVYVCRVRTERQAVRLSLYTVFRQTPVLAVFLLLHFLYEFSYSQWSFMLPAQFGDLYAQNGARFYSILTSVNAVTVIVMTPFLTGFTRKLRPLRAFAMAGIFYVTAYLGFSLGGHYGIYIVLAVLFTLGEISAAIQVGAFVSNHAPAECLGRVNAFSSLVQGASSAFGPLFMGQLLTTVSYASGWRITAGIAAAAMAGFFLLDRKDRKAA